MPEQNYNHHSRYYIPHHLVFYPLMLILCILCIYGLVAHEGQRLLWTVLLLLSLALTGLSLMLRQHYSLMNQNRTVRLELRFRYYVLTQKRFEEAEARLAPKQIYALRFASDAELPALVERALKENLSPDEIKRSIKHWLPDEMRV